MRHVLEAGAANANRPWLEIAGIDLFRSIHGKLEDPLSRSFQDRQRLRVVTRRVVLATQEESRATLPYG